MYERYGTKMEDGRDNIHFFFFLRPFPWLLPFLNILQLPLLGLVLSFLLHSGFYFELVLYKVPKAFLPLDSG